MAEQTFQQQFDEAFEQRSATIGDVTVEVLDESQVDDATSIPATRIENGEAVGWYVAPLSVIMKPIRAAISTLQQLIETVTGQGDRAEQAANSVGSAVRNAQEATSAANTAATNANDSRTLIESNEATRQSNEQTRQSQEQSRVAAEQRRTETFGNDHQTATADHQQAVSDSEQAGTDHQIFVSDHEQAVSDTERAKNDHLRAEDDHAHQPYIADGTEAKPGDIGYSYYWDSESQRYVRGIRISLDWGTMAEEEKDALAAEVLANIAFDTLPTQDSNKAVTSGGLYNALGGQSRLVFASTETCESIIDELV